MAGEVERPSVLPGLGEHRRWGLFQRFVIIALFLASLVLGLWGYKTDSTTWADALYSALQLFTLNFQATPGKATPWTLEIARWAAFAASFYTVLMALFALFRQRLALIRLRWRRDHVVVAGLGEKGLHLVREFSEDHKVTAIELDPDCPNLSVARELGASVLIGDASQDELLRLAGAPSARQVVAVCDDDGVNTQLALRLGELSTTEDRDHKPPLCLVHIVDLSLAALLKHNLVSKEDEWARHVRLFNVLETAARALWDKHPLDREGIKQHDPRQVHLLLAGFDPAAEALLIQAVKIGQFANGKPLKVTVVDPQATTRRGSLLGRHPALEELCELEFIDAPVEDAATQTRLATWAADPGFLTSLAVCLDSDDRGMAMALALRGRLGPSPLAPILVRLSEHGGFTSLLSPKSGIHPFGMVADVCSLPVLLDQVNDQLAMAIHQDYLQEQLAGGAAMGSKPSIAQWNDLESFYQDSNRQQAHHMYVKLRAVGLAVVPKELGEPLDQFRFTPEEVEVLAVMEHARWCVAYRLAGWRLGPRDDKARTHPDLVPWKDLPETSRKWDRLAVRNIPAYLDMIGKGLRRIGV